MTTLPPRIRRNDVPAYLRATFGIEIAPATLAKYACLGGGPALVYFGRVPLYELSALNEWAEARLGARVQSTSDREAAS
ncbi:hypothetical protein [Devosia sp.]|uniref:hypothetical protein n=1 Tax=Devosia sp. TaxID=1871048 RepID=UPI0035AD8476